VSEEMVAEGAALGATAWMVERFEAEVLVPALRRAVARSAECVVDPAAGDR
jgi:hypothetical protein